MLEEVSHYGVHVTPARIAFLLEKTGGRTATGLKIACPYTVKTKVTWFCNHNFNLSGRVPGQEHVDRFHVLLRAGELVRFMLPHPHPGIGLLETTSQAKSIHKIMALSRLCSPIKPPVIWMQGSNIAGVINELKMTNVQPLILMNVLPRDTERLHRIVQAASSSPRRLLIVAHPDVTIDATLVERINSGGLMAMPDDDVLKMPWEQLGALTLHSWMRGEWVNGWFRREPKAHV